MRRVFVIGIDGGTFDVINPLIKEGRLPNISSIIKRGVKAELLSVIPPVTPPAWTSFATGKNPGKHGIVYFLKDTHNYKKIELVNSTHVVGDPFWFLLNKYGYKTILVNVPYTYPPKEIDGIMICGMGTPPEAKIFTYPAELSFELLKKNYVINLGIDSNIPLNEYQLIVDKINYMTEKRAEVVFYLMQKYEWNFFIVVFVSTDRLQHVFWKFMDKDHPGYDPKLAKKFGQVIPAIYEKIDEIIGDILNKLPKDTTVIIVSDHGFGPWRKNFYVNRWLVRERLLSIKHKKFVWKIKYPTIKIFIEKVHLDWMKRFIPNFLLSFKFPWIKREKPNWKDLVDWEKTKAYGYPPVGINVNLKNREPKGIVKDKKEIISLVIEKLKNVQDPKTEEKIEFNVVRSDEVLKGPFIERAPDLIFLPDFCMCYGEDIKDFEKEAPIIEKMTSLSGTHRREGIFIMMGPEVREGKDLGKVKMEDIAPTILYLFGIPIPEDIDGKVLLKGFKEDFVKKNKILFQKMPSFLKDEEKKIYSSKEEEDIKKQLKDLGYL